MKQITLNRYSSDPARASVCSGRLLLLWGAFGLAVAWLWSAVGVSGAAHAAVWALALAGGAALALRVHEGEKA